VAWKDPRTYTVGELLPKSVLDEHIRDQFRWLGGADSRGIVLPTTGLVDGMLFVFVADEAAGVEWLLKYKASVAKWRKIGGPPLFAEVTTSESTSSLTYVALATAGPVITLPLAGTYDVEIGAEQSIAGNAGGSRMSYDIGATPAVDADSTFRDLPGGANGGGAVSVGRWRRKAGLTAGIALTAKYRATAAASVPFASRWMSVDPVFVT
jgi:hypothetical protein